MTSSNGNIFRVTGPLCGEFTGPGEFPAQRPVTRSFDVFFDQRLNKRLSKQPWGWWFETPSWSLWRHRNANDHTYNFQNATHQRKKECDYQIMDNTVLAPYLNPSTWCISMCVTIMLGYVLKHIRRSKGSPSIMRQIKKACVVSWHGIFNWVFQSLDDTKETYRQIMWIQWNPSGKAMDISHKLRIWSISIHLCLQIMFILLAWQATCFERPPSWAALMEGFHCIQIR